MSRFGSNGWLYTLLSAIENTSELELDLPVTRESPPRIVSIPPFFTLLKLSHFFFLQKDEFNHFSTESIFSVRLGTKRSKLVIIKHETYRFMKFVGEFNFESADNNL